MNLIFISVRSRYKKTLCQQAAITLRFSAIPFLCNSDTSYKTERRDIRCKSLSCFDNAKKKKNTVDWHMDQSSWDVNLLWEMFVLSHCFTALMFELNRLGFLTLLPGLSQLLSGVNKETLNWIALRQMERNTAIWLEYAVFVPSLDINQS